MKILQAFINFSVGVTSLFIGISTAYFIYAVKYDTDYPAIVVYENAFFQDKDDTPKYIVRRGDVVFYKKAFCVSLDSPQQLLEHLKEGRENWVKSNDSLMQDQYNTFGPLHGAIKGSFIDTVAISVPTRDFEVVEGCYETNNSIRIPEGLSTGLNTLNFRFTYYRNAIQLALQTGPTRYAKPIQFEVID